MNRDTRDSPAPAGAPRRVVWTARRTWWASLLMAAAALVPLVAAGGRLAPCLLSAIASRPTEGVGGTGGAGAAGASGDAVVGTFTCPWSWSALLCRPLAELAVWLHPAAGTEGVSPTVLLLAIPTLAALLLSGLGLIRAAGVCAATVARAHAGAQEIDHVSLPASHAAPRRVATFTGTAGLPGVQVRVRVLDDARPFAWTYGLWRPQVALSTGLLARLDDAALAAVLTHEAVHVRRHDPLRRLLSRALRHACPQVPVLRALEEHLRLRQEIEADADAMTVARGAAPSARALVSLAANVGMQPVPASLPVVQRRERRETSEAGSWGGTAASPTSTRMSHGWSRLIGIWSAWASCGAVRTAHVQTGDTPRSLRRRVDALLGRVQTGDFLVPSAVVVLSVLGIAAYWCLLVW